MATQKTDVVIVGVGAAGGILAAELGKAGIKVIGLERGPRLKTADFEAHDELRFFQRQDLRPDPKRMPVTWRPNTNATAHPIPSQNNGNRGRRRHGALRRAVVALPRGRFPCAFVDHRALRQSGAFRKIRRSSTGRCRYADLEPYYERAEYELGVSGQAGNLKGKKIDGGNVFEAPRQREYPLKPLLIDQAGVNFNAAAKKLGLHPFSSPHAILSEPYKDRPGCTYCGFCQAFGCHIGAKSSILVTKLPEADATGNFKLVTGAHMLSRQFGQQRQSDRRFVLRARPLRQHHRGRRRHPRAVHLRQRAAAAAVEDGEISERARQFERTPRQAHHGAYRRAGVRGVR